MTHTSTTNLHDLLEVDPTSPSGLRWKLAKGPRAKAGQRAGWQTGNGYWRVEVDGTRHHCHRLVLELSGQPCPFKGAVADHRDKNRNNNTLSNLRWTTQSLNVSRGKGLFRVYKLNKGQKQWVARVRVNKKLYQTCCYSKAAAEVEALALRLQYAWNP